MRRNILKHAIIVGLGLALIGCTNHRDLKISEVGVNKVELYFAEDPGNGMDLDDHFLRYESSNGQQGEVALTGTLAGDQYIVVYEDPNHSGPPRRQNTVNFFGQSILGIVVAGGSFGSQSNADAHAFRVAGERDRFIFPFFFFTDVTDDEVRFGPGTRPDLGGTFTEDDANNPPRTLDNVTRSVAQGQTRGQTLRPRTDGNRRPRDMDREDDWKQDDESYGEGK